MPSSKRPPSKPPQPSTQRPQLSQRRRSDEYSIPGPPFFSLQSYLSNPLFQSLIPFGLQDHIIQVVRTAERQPPAPIEPEISVFVNQNIPSENHARTEIRCCTSNTIGEFKGKVAVQLGLGVEGMVLRRWAGEPGLNDGLMLGDYDIADEASLDLDVSTGYSLESEFGKEVVDSSKSP